MVIENGDIISQTILFLQPKMLVTLFLEKFTQIFGLPHLNSIIQSFLHSIQLTISFNNLCQVLLSPFVYAVTTVA